MISPAPIKGAGVFVSRAKTAQALPIARCAKSRQYGSLFLSHSEPDSPMTSDLFFALLVFCIVASATPGPNNLMLMASGANFGIRRTVPHMLGIMLGFGVMVVLIGAGIAGMLQANPHVYEVLRWASIGYLLYLAWKIANAGPMGREKGRGKPFTFLQAAAFQWVNPKAWATAMTATVVYAPDRSLFWALVVGAVFVVVSVPVVTFWTAMGGQVARLLTAPRALTAFNWIMAALLVASLYPTL